MKKIFLLVFMVLLQATDCFSGAGGQVEFHRFCPANEVKDSNIKSVAKTYIFEAVNLKSLPKIEADAHFMGDSIAIKWALVNMIFQKKSEVSVGFGTTYTEILKPSVFNAAYRMNSYYKKSIKQKAGEEEQIAKQFSWILDCVLAIYYSDNSGGIEHDLAKEKNPENIIQIFNSIKLIK